MVSFSYVFVQKDKREKERVREERMRERREREGGEKPWCVSRWDADVFCYCFLLLLLLVFPGGSDGKESACNVGNPGSIFGSGRSPGEGNGYPLQYSCLKNPIIICGAMCPHPLIEYIPPSPRIFTSWGWGCFSTLWTVLELWWWFSH